MSFMFSFSLSSSFIALGNLSTARFQSFSKVLALISVSSLTQADLDQIDTGKVHLTAVSVYSQYFYDLGGTIA